MAALAAKKKKKKKKKKHDPCNMIITFLHVR